MVRYQLQWRMKKESREFYNHFAYKTIICPHRDLDFTLDNVQVEVVPEPATMGLVGLFGGMIALLRRFHVC